MRFISQLLILKAHTLNSSGPVSFLKNCVEVFQRENDLLRDIFEFGDNLLGLLVYVVVKSARFPI